MKKYLVQYNRYLVTRVLVETDDLKEANKVYINQGTGKRQKSQYYHTQIALIDTETGKYLKEKYQ